MFEKILFKKTLFFIIIILIFFISYKVYVDWKQNFTGKVGVGEGKITIYTKIRNIIPKNIKNIIKNSVLFIPITNEKINKLENAIKLLKKENDELWLSANHIKTKYFPLKLIRQNFPFAGRNQHGKSSAYIDLYKGNVFIFTGFGTSYYVSLNDLIKEKNPVFNKIENNLSDIVKSQYFWDINKKLKLLYSEEMSVKDILIYKDEIYISYNREVSEECFNTSILKADLNYNFLKFENFFTYNDCQSGVGKPVSMKGGGGRIVPYMDDKLLFTIGDSSSLRSQEDDFLLGKIITIDINTSEHEIISKGHRNPQGLIYMKDEDKIFASEHGSVGGDELNLIKKNKNYGWPISSYGKGPQKYRNHEEHGFEEPLHYFYPSIAPSEIVYVPKKFSNSWSNSLLLTSLSGTYGYGRSIYRFKMNEDFNSIDDIEQIKIGDRIRDIKYEEKNNLFLLVLENSNSIGLLYKK